MWLFVISFRNFVSSDTLDCSVIQFTLSLGKSIIISCFYFNYKQLLEVSDKKDSIPSQYQVKNVTNNHWMIWMIYSSWLEKVYIMSERLWL